MPNTRTSLCAALIAMLPIPAAAQILVNGAFETGELEPWRFDADAGAEPTMASTVAPFRNSLMFRLNPGHDGSGGWKGGTIEQSFELEPRTVYIVSGNLYIQNLRTGTNTNGGRIAVTINDREVFLVEAGATPGLAVLEHPFSIAYRTEHGGRHIIRIHFSRPWRNSNPVSMYHWADNISVARPYCYANCDASTALPLLNIDDFTCFINQFAEAQALTVAEQRTHYANCDHSTIAPVLNVDDFTCFLNRYAAGCP
jgi:hypothetical protein